MMPAPRHRGLQSYLTRNQVGVADDRADGAVVLVFDEQYRVYCRPAPRGDLVLETNLTTLPDDLQHSDAMLSDAVRLAAQNLDTQADALVLSEDQRELLLQRRLSADAGMDEFEQGLGDFINAIGDWRRSLCVL
jgi:hypothetical protein